MGLGFLVWLKYNFLLEEPSHRRHTATEFVDEYIC